MVTTKDILRLLDTIAPFNIAEEWDNSGLQVGDPAWEVKKIMIALDVTMPLMKAAKNWNCDLVLTHHPLMITPENSFDFSRMPGQAIFASAVDQISIVSLHTNLDKASGGLNDFFASKIGIDTTLPFLPIDFENNDIQNGPEGIGRTGYLPETITLNQLVSQIKSKLQIEHLRVSGDLSLPVRNIAICTGSGGSLINDFIKSGADVFITGDTKYHEARTIEEHSKALIDVGHFASEHIVIELLNNSLSQVITKTGLNIQIKKFLNEKDPFTIM